MTRMVLAAAMVLGVTLAGVAETRAASFSTLGGGAPIVIGHRGASGYLPEHTLASYELAAKMGADYIEPDLQLASDGVLVAIHDVTLDRTTNVADVFAPRNGGFAVGDFTVAEIKTLTIKPTRGASTTFPGFTPSTPNPLQVVTFQEVLDFVTGYNAANGTDIGVYPEAKSPTSATMNRLIVEQLKDSGFSAPTDKAFIQSFSFEALRDISTIQAVEGTDLAQVALGAAVIEDGAFKLFDFVTSTSVDLADVAGFARGMGVSIGSSSSGLGAEWIAAAHALGLQVHGWTFRPADIDAARALFQPFINIGMDGFFTDFPDLGVQVVAENVAPVPLPAPVALLALGLAALVGVARRRA